MGIPLRVLIIEDSEDDSFFLVHELKKGGYEPLYQRVWTHESLKAALFSQEWDIIISDYKMPRFDGFAALKTVKESALDIPFILISGQIGEATAIEAMRAGAHDYIVKGTLGRLVPAIERELRDAEVRRVRRRIEAELNEHRIHLESLVEERTAELKVANKRLQREIAERKQMEEALRYQAYHDLLTGLPNRILFLDRLNLALYQAARERCMLAVIFLDLDRFKNINDSMGHSAGDQVLRNVAACLKTCIRESDTIARIGGDEFTILLPSVLQPEDASKVARKILGAFQKPCVVEGQELFISPSIGISIYPDDGKYAETLLKNADIAMYHAKGQGRNNYQFYDPAMNIRTLERMILENSLRQTLQRGELVVYYQPQLHIGTRRMIGVEALVRWQHPELGLLDPMQFIPLAEETGFIVPIDEWVLHTACVQGRAWQDAGRCRLCVTVNLSARQFQQPNLVEVVSQVLKDTGLGPEFLEIEITERIAMQNIELTIPVLQKLTDMGVRLSIDDFGTGYSSLSYLKKLPIQKLKIDKSFVRGLSADPDDQAIVNAVIALAHSLNLRVTAEGVESEEQLAFLLLSGCDEIQGFLVSQPLQAEEFEKLVLPEFFPPY